MSGELRWQRRRDGWWIGSHNLAGRYRGAVAECLRASIAGKPRQYPLGEGWHIRCPYRNAGGSCSQTDRVGSALPVSDPGGWGRAYSSRLVLRARHGRREAGYPGFTSSLQYHFENTDLTYHPDWPRLRNATGQASVQGADSTVTLSQGRLVVLTSSRAGCV